MLLEDFLFIYKLLGDDVHTHSRDSLFFIVEADHIFRMLVAVIERRLRQNRGSVSLLRHESGHPHTLIHRECPCMIAPSGDNHGHASCLCCPEMIVQCFAPLFQQTHAHATTVVLFNNNVEYIVYSI